jgi:hypothetical protein
VEQAQNTIDALNQNLQLGQQRASYYLEQTINVPNTAEQVGITLSSAALLINYSTAVAYAIAAGTHLVPFFTFGASRFGGSPQANAATGGNPLVTRSRPVRRRPRPLPTRSTRPPPCRYQHASDDWFEKWAEQQTDLEHTQTQIAGATLGLQIAQQNQTNHQTQIDSCRSRSIS